MTAAKFSKKAPASFFAVASIRRAPEGEGTMVK
jgi:hypothetical protein